MNANQENQSLPFEVGEPASFAGLTLIPLFGAEEPTPDGLSYPTQPAFDTTAGSTTLYLANGAFMNGVPDIEAFDIDTRACQCPDDGRGGRRSPTVSHRLLLPRS